MEKAITTATEYRNEKSRKSIIILYTQKNNFEMVISLGDKRLIQITYSTHIINSTKQRC